MAGEFIQLGGKLELGPVGGPLIDFSDNVTQFRLGIERNVVTRPPTLGDPTEVDLAGHRKGTLTIAFFSDIDATSIWAELYDTIMTDLSQFDWSGLWNPGVVGVNNRRYFGTATLMNLDTGNEVGALRDNEVSCPLVSWQFVTV